MARNKYLIDQIDRIDDPALLLDVVDKVTDKMAGSHVEPADEIIHIQDVRQSIEDEYRHWGSVRGLRTGYPSLDKRIAGMGKGHVILVGGETSNGKSALATNIAVNVARNHGVLFITLEMMIAELGSRIMQINNRTIDGLDMMFQKEHRLTYKDIKPLIKKAMEQGNVEFVVLDYLQYLGRGMTNDEVAKMSKEIKTIAVEFSIPIMVIVSLRKSEGGKARRKWTDIEIEDLMGAGAIGYDCDVAMIVSRKNLDNEFADDSVWVKILKTRNSRLDYNDRYTRFDWNSTKITEAFEELTPAEQQGFEQV